MFKGSDSSASIIRTFTNVTAIPDLVISTGSKILIVFISDGSAPVSTGIHIKWSGMSIYFMMTYLYFLISNLIIVIAPAVFCSGLTTITSQSGTIVDHTTAIGPYRG